MTKYVIFVNTEFYPYVYEEYDDLEQARSVFEQKEAYDEDVYLCEVIEKPHFRHPSEKALIRNTI